MMREHGVVTSRAALTRLGDPSGGLESVLETGTSLIN